MNKVLQTKTHLAGGAAGLVATVVGLFGSNLHLAGGQSQVAIGGGLLTIAATVVFKLLADMGISKATVEKDYNDAKQFLESYNALKPLLDEIPFFKSLNTELVKLEDDLDAKGKAIEADVMAKINTFKSEIEVEIAKIPQPDRAYIVSVIQSLLNPPTPPPPTPAPAPTPAPSANPAMPAA